MSEIGTVIIGQNEGERLVRCLASVSEQYGHVVYVDSGSADDSIEAARRAGAEVVALNMTTPFTAARARNVGASTLMAHGAVDFVQFIDGDCEMQPGWLEAGTSTLRSDPTVAAVAGRLRERFPDAAVYNRLCDMEWNMPAGEAMSLGGIALYRCDAFQDARGFDETLIAGEEPELCLRLRRAGWSILRTADEMALHDAAMTRFGQFTKRATRSGWAYSEGADRHGSGPERYNVADLRRIWLWAAWAPGAILGLALLWLLTGSSWLLGLAALGSFAYPAMVLKIARHRAQTHGDPWSHALLYGAFITLGRFWQLKGALQYRAHKARGDRAKIIESK